MHSTEQLEAVIADCSNGEGERVVADILAGLEASGDGVDGVEQRVADPVATGRDESDLNWLIAGVLEVDSSLPS